ncbi:PAS domain-containing protein [Flavobacterium gawalongense]|uniref:histidine kinase n=3 Tax=Flavobacterium gawalongense TaxID=2594432 RepID=A0A553BK38_9FLAO|nr:PAS domain-containing protein [Flavobacterium gawalongense]TRX00335.1 PAS domain S-box protein [Flavobacterium gawalongense]TRX08611.1 PAS domain S-box protein [Flavobacterium gawalongense]TRX09594.1 PAS domain S-box protein [Flavobacterium gawalongense]TRX25603.1 PAS domain S-box protein [Flavobacterium gawalongense]
MKISFEKKIFLGFIINLFAVIALSWVFVLLFDRQRELTLDKKLNWIALSLFVLSIILFSFVYYIIRTQLHVKNASQNLLFEDKQLLDSVFDNTSNPIFIKKINGEYLLINKQCESLFQISSEEIKGKTDHDFLPKKLADAYRNSDLEVVKALRELKTEETIHLPDGSHTYIAIKFPLYDLAGRIYAIGGISTDITERKKLEETFKAADKLFYMSLDIMVIMSEDKFVKINPALSNLLGYSEEELLSQPFLTYVHPKDHIITQKEIVKLQMGILTIKFENRWICKDGSIKSLVWSASPDLSTGLIYAVAHDVTLQKEIESSLVVAQKFFNMSYDMLVVSKGEYFEKVNPAFTRNLGYDQKDMDGKPFLSIAHPDDANAYIDAINKLKKGESMVNHRARARCKDGSYKWLDWSSTIDIQTGIMYAVARDVTEIVENEGSLKMSEKFFNMSYDILVVAKGEYFEKVNPAFTRNLGYDQKDMDGKPFLSIAHPDDANAYIDAINKLKKGESMVNHRARARCKDESYKWLDWSSTVDIKTGIMYAVARDVTEIVENEGSLKMSEKFFNMSYDMLVVAKGEYFEKVNPAFTRNLGYDQKDMDGKPFLSIAHPDDANAYIDAINKLKKGESMVNHRARARCKDESYKWLDWSSTVDIKTGIMYAVARDVTEIVENEGSLKMADKFFNMSYDMLVVAKGEYFEKVNPAFTRNLGYDQKDMDGKPFLSIAHPDDANAYIDAINKLKKGESMVNHRARARCKDGSYKWLDWSSTVDIKTGIMYAVARDVTEIVENEGSLKMADKFFNLAFDILTVAKEEHFIKINPAFTKTLGYDEKDLDKIKFTDLTHPDDKGVANEMFAKLLEGEPVVNFRDRVLCKDGTYKWLDWHSNFDLQHGVLYSVARDISEQIKLEEEQQTVTKELYENEEKLRLILENLSEGVIVANADKKIVLVNDMANEFFGIREDDKISPNIIDHFEIYYPDEKTIFPSQNLPMDRALKGESTDDIDVVLLDPATKEKKRILISGRPLADQNNNVIAFVLTIKDISKYKQLEAELKETESKYRQLIGFKKADDKEV